jgi:hypothetical protein
MYIPVPEKKNWGQSKIRVTGPNGIMVAQTFCDWGVFGISAAHLYLPKLP